MAKTTWAKEDKTETSSVDNSKHSKDRRETKDDRRLDERRETQRQGTIDAKIRDDGRSDKRR